MHQIRRHLSAIGHPVVADKRYGGGDMPELPGFALHSFRTTLNRVEAEPLTVCAPLADDMLNLCERRGIGRDPLLEVAYRLI
jgi:23S rRNA pseudouridine955/2504/2580 synthase